MKFGHTNPDWLAGNMTQFKYQSSSIFAVPSQWRKQCLLENRYNTQMYFLRALLGKCLLLWKVAKALYEMAHPAQFVEVILGYPNFISINMLSWALALNDLRHHCPGDEDILDLLTKDFHQCDVTCINPFPPGK